MAYLSAKKLAPSTISTYISALKKKLDLSLIPPKHLLYTRSRLLKAGSARNRTYGCLSLAPYYINWCWLNSHHHAAYHTFQTMLLVAFSGFFRVGELTIKTSERHSVLQFQSLSFLKSRSEVQAAKLVISIINITQPGERPFSIIIHRDSTVQFCPVAFFATTLVPCERIQFWFTFLPS